MPPLSKEVQDIVTAIQQANKTDEIKIVDDILLSVKQNRLQPFDILYIDLSIDRSAKPLRITGAGTLILAVEATDDLANLTIGFPGTESDSNKRIQMKDGKRLFLPYTEFFVYHSAQSGKYMKLLRGREMPSLKIGVEDDSGESANSDLSTALGNSSGFTPTQVSVTTASTTIIAANTSRRRVTLVNTDAANIVYINDGVATTSHFPLMPGAYLVLNTTVEIRGIVSAGTALVGVMEE